MKSRLLLVIAFIGFISLGLPDPVASVAWPSVREAFGLKQRAFGLIFLALGAGYFTTSFCAGKLTRLLGMGNLLCISSGLVAIAMFSSGAAVIWPMFVASAVVWGLGSGGIDAGLNTYVSKSMSPRQLNWLHACYSIGASVGPLIMTAMLVSTGSWRLGYVVVGGILLCMATLFYVTRERWNDGAPTPGEDAGPPVSIREALSHPLVWFQIGLFFLHVGLEVTVGQWTFTLLTSSRDVSVGLAGTLASSYYASIGAGRVLTGVIANRISLDRLLRLSMLLALAGTLLFAFGWRLEMNIVGLIAIGLGLGPVFPCLVSRTPERMGDDHAAHTVGFQVSAGMVGGAVLPGTAALLASSLGLEIVPKFAVLAAASLFTLHELLMMATERQTSTRGGAA